MLKKVNWQNVKEITKDHVVTCADDKMTILFSGLLLGKEIEKNGPTKGLIIGGGKIILGVAMGLAANLVISETLTGNILED